MQDTTSEVRRRHLELWEALPESRRLLLALRMYDHGREVMRAGIRHDAPELTACEVEQRLFLRMYGDELPQPMIDRALGRIAERFQNGNGPGSNPISTRPTAS